MQGLYRTVVTTKTDAPHTHQQSAISNPRDLSGSLRLMVFAAWLYLAFE
jgi:hypothetical protein